MKDRKMIRYERSHSRWIFPRCEALRRTDESVSLHRQSSPPLSCLRIREYSWESLALHSMRQSFTSQERTSRAEQNSLNDTFRKSTSHQASESLKRWWVSSVALWERVSSKGSFLIVVWCVTYRLIFKNRKDLLLCPHLLEESNWVDPLWSLCLLRVYDDENEISSNEETKHHEYYFRSAHILRESEERRFWRKLFLSGVFSHSSLLRRTLFASERRQIVLFFVWSVALVLTLFCARLWARFGSFGVSDTTRTFGRERSFLSRAVSFFSVSFLAVFVI